MSLKTKLTSLITTFVLLCSLLTVGVFAVKNTTFNVGGDIVFNVQGIEATITRDATAGFTADKTIGNQAGNILSDIELNNDMTAEEVSAEFAPWSGLNLTFSENVATIKLTIKNTAEEGADNYLDISAIASATTKNNAKIKVVNDAGGATALLAPQVSASFTISFSVVDDEYSASLNGFNVNFDIEKKVIADFPSYDAVDFLTFNCIAGPNIAILTAQNITESNTILEIPSYVRKDSVLYYVGSFQGTKFNNSGNLKEFIFPSTLTEWEYDGFFDNSTNLEKVVIPGNIEVVPTFRNCNSLSKVVIEEGVSGVGMEAFKGCANLTSISFPDSISGFDSSAFENCINLTTVTFGTGIEYFDANIFKGCTSLNTINYRGSKEEWKAIDQPYGDAFPDGILDNVTINYNYVD